MRRAPAYESRLTSAAAHARAWPLHVRASISEALPDRGVLRRTTTSIEDVATLMTSEALRLWDERRTKHH